MALNTPLFALVSTYSSMLKQVYGPGGENGPQNMKFEVGPLYTDLMAGVDPNAGGFNVPFPVGVGGGGGVSNTFIDAQANQTPSSTFAFLMQPAEYFGLVTIDSLLLQASVGQEEAYVKARVWEIDNVRRSMQTQIAADLYGDGTGVRGSISAGSDVTTATITLANPADIVKFDTGYTIVLQSSANRGTGTNTMRAGQATITAIQFTGSGEGQLTFSAALNSLITSPSTGDFIYLQGANYLALDGLQAWGPSTPPTSGVLFNGVDRSVNSRLTMVYTDQSAVNVREAATNAIAILQQQGGSPKKLYISYARFAQLSLLLQSDGRYNSQPTGGTSGFAELEVVLGASKIMVVADRWCADNDGWLIDPSDWKLLSVGAVPHFVESDIGSVILRVPNASAFECRLEAFVNLACHAPGHQARINFAALP